MLKRIKTIIACVLMVTIISTMGLAGLTAAADSSAAAPMVLSVTPSGDEITKAYAGSVVFDSAMDLETLTFENIKVTDVTNGNVPVEQIKTSAYDTEYVFICEFEPNTTYNITVGTNVKNAEGTALEEEYVHTFSTGDELEDVALANPDSAEKYTHNSEGKHDGSLSYVYDGKLDGIYYTYNAEGPASRYVAIDLGKKTQLSHISFVPKKSGWNDSWGSGVKIQAATEPDYSDAVDLAVLPTLSNDDSGIIEYIAVADDTLYRYIRIIKNSINLSVVEISVYNYPSTEIIEVDPVNVGLNKEISYNEKLGIYGSGVKTSVNDGVTSASKYVAFNPASASTGEMSYFRFDLLKPYPITRLNFYTRNEAKSDTDNMTIYGSNELCPVEEMDVLYECPSGLPTGQKNVIPLEGASYRYITFQKVKNGHFCVCEVEVMSPTAINFNNEWKTSNRTSSFRVKLDGVESYEDENEFLMLFMGYDEDGYLSYLDTASETLSKGVNNLDVQVSKPDGTKEVYVTSIESFEDLNVVYRPKTTPENPFKEKRAEVSLKGEETAIFTLLKSGESFEDGFDEDEILFADMKMADENKKAIFSYDFRESDGTGAFEARTYITHADGTVTIEQYTIYHYTQASFDKMAEDFDEAKTNAEFAEVLKKYTVTTPHFTLDEIPEVKDSKVNSAIGEDFIRIKDLFIKESGNSTNDIIDALKTAYILYSAKNQSDDKVLTKYGKLIDFYDAKKFKENKVLEMLKRLDDKITDGESFEKACRDACIYSLMLDSGVEATVDMIKNYADELGIDLSYCEDNNISITDVVKKLDRENPEKYVGTIGEDFEEIAKEIYKERGESSQNRVDRGTGGSKGGGGGSAFYPTNEENNKEEPKDDVITEKTEEAVFADIEGYSWATEAIEALAEKNIISGVDGVNFMPQAEIKREEFSKMIFLTFKLAREEGKMSEFADCDKESWYYPYVDALYASGIINGVSETEFGVGTLISRQDAATILSRVAESCNKNMAKGEMNFVDSDSIAEYAKDSVSKLSKAGIITGFDDNSFKPADSITRAQAAVMIYRMMQYIGA